MEENLHFIGLGIVAVDKELTSNEISIYMPDKFSLVNGEIKAHVIKHSAKAVDSKNVVKQDSIEGSVLIPAKWRPYGATNRITAPDVVEGENVIVFKHFDTDIYYWDSWGREPTLRRGEKVCYMFSNVHDGKGEIAFDKDSSYWFEVNTIDKYVQLHTSNNDGEATTYDIHIDTKNGIFTLIDGNTDGFELDSGQRKLTINIETEAIVNTKKATVNSESILLGGDTEINGNLKLNGNLQLGGSISTTSGGNLGIQNNVDIAGNITANNIP